MAPCLLPFNAPTKIEPDEYTFTHTYLSYQFIRVNKIYHSDISQEVFAELDLTQPALV
jgi:hypothetical protein